MVERLKDVTGGITVRLKSESAISREPAKVVIYKNGVPMATIEARIVREQGADGDYYGVVRFESKETRT